MTMFKGRKRIFAEESPAQEYPAGEVWGGVPAHFIMKTDDYAEKCLKNTPPHDDYKLQHNKREETLRLTK